MGKTNDAASTFRARTSTFGAKEDPNKHSVTCICDKEDTKLLAALKHIDVRLTRVTSRPSLQVLGLYDDVVTVFQTPGMGRYWEMDEDIYPKLVKEFIATCRLTYANPENPKASQGKLTFFLNKQHYSKTLFEICDMYRFTKGEEVEFPKLSHTVELNSAGYPTSNRRRQLRELNRFSFCNAVC